MHRPDVVVTDIRMPPSHTDEGIRAARSIRAEHPETGVVVLSQYVEPDYALTLFEAGSGGIAYLLKERVGDIDQLRSAIDEVCAGGSVIDPKVVDALVEGRLQRRESKLDRLTPREREVMAEIADRQEQRRHRRRPVPVTAGRREAHQFDLHQARPAPRARRQSTGPGGPSLPGGDGRVTVWKTTPLEACLLPGTKPSAGR